MNGNDPLTVTQVAVRSNQGLTSSVSYQVWRLNPENTYTSELSKEAELLRCSK